MDKVKCNKCDERGYITIRENGGSHGRSCECGWAIQQQANYFKGWSLDELVAFKQRKHGN